MSFIIPNAAAKAIQNKLRLYAKESRVALTDLDLALIGIVPDEAIPVLVKIAQGQSVLLIEVVTMFAAMKAGMDQRDVKDIVGGNLNYQWFEGLLKQNATVIPLSVVKSAEKPAVAETKPVERKANTERKVIEADDNVDVTELEFTIFDGDLWVTYPDGRRVNLGRVVGRDGRQGGGSSGPRTPYVVNILYDDNTLTVVYNDGQEDEIEIVSGFDPTNLPEADLPLDDNDRVIIVQDGIAKSTTLLHLKEYMQGIIPDNVVHVDDQVVLVDDEYVVVN